MFENIFGTKKPVHSLARQRLEPSVSFGGKSAEPEARVNYGASGAGRYHAGSYSTGPFGGAYLYGRGGFWRKLDALAIPAVLRCVSLIAGHMAAQLTDKNLRIVDADGLQLDAQKDLKALLTRTAGDGVSSYELFYQAFSDMLLDGNGLVAIDRSARTGKVLDMWRANPSTAERTVSRNGVVYHLENTNPDSVNLYPYNAKSVLHFRMGHAHENKRHGFSAPMFYIAYPAMARTMTIGGFMEEHYGGSSWKRFLSITHNQPLDAEQIKKMGMVHSEQISDPDRLVHVSGDQAKIQDHWKTAAQEDLVNMWEFMLSEICRVYGVPEILVGMNRSNLGVKGPSEVKRLFNVYTLNPKMRSVLAELELKLLREGEWFQPDPFNTIRNDWEMAKELVPLLGGTQNPAACSVDEFRSIFGFNPAKTPENKMPAQAVNSA